MPDSVNMHVVPHCFKFLETLLIGREFAGTWV